MTRASQKKEIIERLAGKTDLPLEDAERVWTAVVEMMRENIEEGRNLSFAPVGLLVVKKMPPRQSFSPHVGGLVDVPARHVVSFRISHGLDQQVRKSLAEEEAG